MTDLVKELRQFHHYEAAERIEDHPAELQEAKQDGYQEGHQAAFKTIRECFAEKNVSRSTISELDPEKARQLLYTIYYTVNY